MGNKLWQPNGEANNLNRNVGRTKRRTRHPLGVSRVSANQNAQQKRAVYPLGEKDISQSYSCSLIQLLKKIWILQPRRRCRFDQGFFTPPALTRQPSQPILFKKALYLRFLLFWYIWLLHRHFILTRMTCLPRNGQWGFSRQSFSCPHFPHCP